MAKGSSVGSRKTITKMGRESNAIKLGSIYIIDQGLPQGLSRFLHQRILFGTPFPDTRFIPIGTVGIDDQRGQRLVVACRCQPSGGVDEADPLDGYLLTPCRLGHD